MDFIRTKWGIPIRDMWFKDTHEAKGHNLLSIAYNLYEPLCRAKGITLKKWQSQTFVTDILVSTE